jgi:hypothetical protein
MLTLLPDGEPANINGVAYVADLQRVCAMPTRADIEIRELGPEEWDQRVDEQARKPGHERRGVRAAFERGRDRH